MRKITIILITLLIASALYFGLIFTLIQTSKQAVKNSDYLDLKPKIHLLSAIIYPLDIISKPINSWHQQIHAGIELLDFTSQNIDTYIYFQNFYKGILNKNKSQVFINWNKLFPKASKFLAVAPLMQENLILLQNKHPQLLKTVDIKQKLNWDIFKDLLSQMPDLIGLNGGPKTYLVFLQNQKELRPTGGFMGSYVQITFEDGILSEVKGQDIYVPDGALMGHVNPPDPIQSAFKTGFWKLRDANWDPDFAVSAENIRWFLEKANFESGDAIIAVNFSVIEDLLDLFQSIYLPDNNQTISKDNLYLSAQNAAENDFFPGSIQKKDFLQNLLNQIFLKFQNLDSDQMQKLTSLLGNNLEKKNIILNFTNKSIQNVVEKQNWGGRINVPNSQDLKDYIYIVESNLGANKANCCVQRDVSLDVDIANNLQINTLRINYANLSQKEKEQPPKFWGGDYQNYLRVYLPPEIQVNEVLIDGSPIKADLNRRKTPPLKVVGFFVNVPHLDRKEIVIKYQHNISTQVHNYNLIIQKQSGLWPYNLNLNVNYAGDKYFRKLQIDKDQEIVVNY